MPAAESRYPVRLDGLLPFSIFHILPLIIELFAFAIPARTHVVVLMPPSRPLEHHASLTVACAAGGLDCCRLDNPLLEVGDVYVCVW